MLFSCPKGVGGCHSLFGNLYDAAGISVDALARFGQRNAVIGARKECQFQFCLQQVDLLDEGIGRDEQLFRRLGEAAAVCCHQECVQMLVIHCYLLHEPLG